MFHSSHATVVQSQFHIWIHGVISKTWRIGCPNEMGEQNGKISLFIGFKWENLGKFLIYQPHSIGFKWENELNRHFTGKINENHRTKWGILHCQQYRKVFTSKQDAGITNQN